MEENEDSVPSDALLTWQNQIPWIEHRQDLCVADATLRIYARFYGWKTGLEHYDECGLTWNEPGPAHQPLRTFPMQKIYKLIGDWWFDPSLSAPSDDIPQVTDDQLNELYAVAFSFSSKATEKMPVREKRKGGTKGTGKMKRQRKRSDS